MVKGTQTTHKASPNGDEYISAAEVKRYLGALQEENRDGHKATQERLSGVEERMDGMQKTLDEHTERLNTHTEMIGDLKVRMAGMEEKMGNVEGRLTGVEDKLEAIQEDATYIKSSLKQKVDQEEFDSLTRRVMNLEKRMAK